MRVMVLGGYGGFGARLSRRLAGDGWQVIVAGRNARAGAALAEQLPGAEAMVVDRKHGLEKALLEAKPFLLVDAAGPFQDDDGSVVEACIGAGVHYLDIADARDFVSKIGRFDAAAGAAGLTVISGGSSVPGLSSAVVAELAAGMEMVRSVEMSISASNRATAGASVARAILSYVGRPIRLWQGRRWVQATGWHRVRREHYVSPGKAPLNRLVALADVPDHELLPTTLKGAPATIFRAGPEFSFQLLALWLLSWPVHWGWLASLAPLARWMLPLQGLTARLGSDRSAMKVVVKGIAKGKPSVGTWTLIAEQGDGLEIPTLAAQLLARQLREGGLKPGAVSAQGLLELSAFRPLFGQLAIVEHSERMTYRPLYERVMGQRFAALPEPVRSMHEVIGDGGASGTATVRRGKSILARLIAGIIGFPPEGEHELHVGFSEVDGAETWTRNFSGRRFASRLSQVGTRLTEQFGQMRFYFDLPLTQDGLEMVMRKWTIFGLPMPMALAPRSAAREWAEAQDFCFDVPIALPLIGMVVHYRGRLRRL